MTIFEKVREIYETHYLCAYCLGRMFSLLGTDTTNLERGNSLLLSMLLEAHRNYLSSDSEKRESGRTHLELLAENMYYGPAQNVLEKEGIECHLEEKPKCHICKGIFSRIEEFASEAVAKVEDLEFHNLLVGTSPDPEIINTEDQFKTKFHLLEAESFKSHFNREVGKCLNDLVDKPTEFSQPDIVFIFHLGYQTLNIELIIKSVFIYGRYNKLIRGIPQTHWLCGKCQGKGCKECDFTGKRYQTSVEGLISEQFIKASHAADSKFHGAGREDIDVRMLGNGRPFVLELIKPKVRNLNLEEIKKIVNTTHEGKVKIQNLRYSDKNEVISLKENAEDTIKVYEALVESEREIQNEEFKDTLQRLQEEMVDQRLQQRTPQRVSHRRADKYRSKKIYAIEAIYLDTNHFKFTFETQGGTYIKELITGDEGRTSPSISELFETSMKCVELDVIEIKH